MNHKEVRHYKYFLLVSTSYASFSLKSSSLNTKASAPSAILVPQRKRCIKIQFGITDFIFHHKAFSELEISLKGHGNFTFGHISFHINFSSEAYCLTYFYEGALAPRRGTAVLVCLLVFWLSCRKQI